MADSKKQDIDLNMKRLEYGDRLQRAVLTLYTHKMGRGIISSASVSWCGENFRSHVFGMGGDGGGDFSKRLLINAGARGTQKAIDTQHAQVFTPETIAQLVIEAKAHYAKYVAAGIDGYKNKYVTEEVAV